LILEFVDDFQVDEEDQRWVGILIIIERKVVWIFEIPVHGQDVCWGPKREIGRNWGDENGEKN